MLTSDENELLTRIGPGTRMGALLRRYWHVVAPVDEMTGPCDGAQDRRWTKRVRLLGEDLVLFRDRSGRYGLVGEFCPHRRASLAYGIPTEDGIRCPYHGWKFDGTGRCLEQPNEPEGPVPSLSRGSSFKDKVRTAGYPVQELGGLLFAYLGPEPVPLLPRYDGYVDERAIRIVSKSLVPCNWLQIMENSLDPVHLEWLHGKLYEFVQEQRGERTAFAVHHKDIAFAEFEYGIYKRRLLEGQPLDASDWTVGHPVIFPTTLAVGQAGGLWRQYAFQIRVPLDDTHTMHYWYGAFVPPADVDIPDYMLDRVAAFDFPFLDERGEFRLDMIDAQDVLAWVTPGPIVDRTQERLSWTDRGVIQYRKMLLRELAKVEAGADPMGVIRDPAKNAVIAFPIEHGRRQFQDGFAAFIHRTSWSHYPHAEELIEIIARQKRVAAV
jgi:5,5'-dehydrodivanillate O-demethylase oxygenase subunit